MSGRDKRVENLTKLAKIHSPAGRVIDAIHNATGADDQSIVLGAGGLAGGLLGAGVGVLPGLLVPRKRPKQRGATMLLGGLLGGLAGAAYGSDTALNYARGHDMMRRRFPKDIFVLKDLVTKYTPDNSHITPELSDKDPFMITAHGGGQHDEHMLGSTMWGRKPLADVIAENPQKMRDAKDWSLLMRTCNANGLCYTDLVDALKKNDIPLPKELAMAPPRAYGANLLQVDPKTGLPVNEDATDEARDIYSHTHKEMLNPDLSINEDNDDHYFIRKTPFLEPDKNREGIDYMKRFLSDVNDPRHFSDADIRELGYTDRKEFDAAYAKQAEALKGTLAGAWGDAMGPDETEIQQAVVQTQVRPGHSRASILPESLGVAIGASPSRKGRENMLDLRKGIVEGAGAPKEGTTDAMAPLKEALRFYDALRKHGLSSEDALKEVGKKSPEGAAAVEKAIGSGMILARAEPGWGDAAPGIGLAQV